MMQTEVPREEAIREFRHMLPAGSATAGAIDRQEPWEVIAMRAIDDGYIDAAHEFGWFVGVCVRRSAR
jgi:hypothetical protein